jgi:hypothetical protein
VTARWRIAARIRKSLIVETDHRPARLDGRRGDADRSILADKMTNWSVPLTNINSSLTGRRSWISEEEIAGGKLNATGKFDDHVRRTVPVHVEIDAGCASLLVEAGVDLPRLAAERPDQGESLIAGGIGIRVDCRKVDLVARCAFAFRALEIGDAIGSAWRRVR